MKRILILVLTVMMFGACDAQTESKTQPNNNELSNKTKPKIDYKVNKEYDKDGNLIRYDSVYTYYYSNVDKDALINDSIFQKLNEHFENNSLLSQNPLFKDLIDKDQSLEDDFFTEDFFQKSFERNQQLMNEFLLQMDSVKNQFFMDNYPLNENRLEKNE